MKTNRYPILRDKRRGSILLFSVTLIALIAIGAMLLGRTALDHQRANQRRRGLWSALLMAESGVALIQHWAANPADFTNDTDLFEATDSSYTSFPQLSSAMAGVSDGEPFLTVSREDLAGMGEGDFADADGKPIGVVQEIHLLKPDPSNDPVPSFMKIRARGRTWDGLERTVVAYAGLRDTFSIQIPAALLSFESGAMSGNVKVHWGEAWTKDAFNLESENNLSYLSHRSANYDPLAIYRSESEIIFPNSWEITETKNNGVTYGDVAPDPGADGDYGTGDDGVFRWPAREPHTNGDYSYQDLDGNYHDAFEQMIPEGVLQWPELESLYQEFKNIAIANGRYYSTDPSGNVYLGGVEDSAHRVNDLLAELGVADRTGSPEDLVFIDTIDGNPPADDGSNLANISVSGNSLGLEGVYYICANFDATGVGSPPGLAVTNPNTNTAVTLQKIFVDGVLYAAGTLSMGGNAGVYGSVIAQRGFLGGGTPDVYYNQALADGIGPDDGNAGSPFEIVLHTNYGGED